MSYKEILETYIEREEFITAQEYFVRRQKGEITPSETRFTMKKTKKGVLGGFIVKRKNPIYKTYLDSLAGENHA